MRFVLFLIYLCLVLPQLAAAENTPAHVTVPLAPIISAEFEKGLRHISTSRIDSVIDAQTVRMKDGKIVRLLGIGYPFMAGDMEGAAQIAAKARLEKMLRAGDEIMLYQTRDAKIPRASRMGHTLAHLVVKDKNEWINGTLVREGAAWTVTDSNNPHMAAELYALEQAARDEQKGLWGQGSPFGVLTPETAHEGNGTFRIVEGTVERAATSKNNLYLNFGNDWRKDFTVMVTPALRKALSRKGIDPMALTGSKIRVRGWLREWNGPFMELETAERLEILSAESLPTP